MLVILLPCLFIIHAHVFSSFQLTSRVDDLSINIPKVLSRAGLQSAAQFSGFKSNVGEAQAFIAHDYTTESDVHVDWNREFGYLTFSSLVHYLE